MSTPNISQLRQIKSDLAEMLTAYKTYVILAENTLTNRWADYYRGNQAGRISMAKDIINELSFTLEDSEDKKQDHEDL